MIGIVKPVHMRDKFPTLLVSLLVDQNVGDVVGSERRAVQSRHPVQY